MNSSMRSDQVTDQGWNRAQSDTMSMQSNSNMFHPRGHSLDQSETGSIHDLSRAKAKLLEAKHKKEEEKKKVMEDWGFEKEETMAIWEAR